MNLGKYIPYSQKIWRGIKFGGIILYYNRQISYSHIYVWRSCTKPPNIKSANISGYTVYLQINWSLHTTASYNMYSVSLVHTSLGCLASLRNTLRLLPLPSLPLAGLGVVVIFLFSALVVVVALAGCVVAVTVLLPLADEGGGRG